MEPIPVYARVLGIVVAILVLPVTVLTVLGGVLTAATTYASSHHSATYLVGDAPRLRLNVQGGDVLVEEGDTGRIAVEEQHSVGTITRAGAVAQLGQTRFSAGRSGDEVTVTQTGPSFRFATFNRASQLTARVPPRTDLDITSFGVVEVEGVTGRVIIHQSVGDVMLRNVGLVGDSTVSAGGGSLHLLHVTVSGRASLQTRLGDIVFDGDLAPGGTELSVGTTAGDVTLTLPYPTDARVSVVSQAGTVHADPIWHLVNDRSEQPRRWSGEMGPNPTGSVAVTSNLGDVTLLVR